MGLVLAVRTPVIVPTVARLAASPIYRCITPAIGSTTDATVEVAAELRDRLVSRLKRTVDGRTQVASTLEQSATALITRRFTRSRRRLTRSRRRGSRSLRSLSAGSPTTRIASRPDLGSTGRLLMGEIVPKQHVMERRNASGLIDMLLGSRVLTRRRSFALA